MIKKPVNIIGIGLSSRSLTSEHLELIQSADVLIGGRRLLDFFSDSPAEKVEIHKNIKRIIEYLKKATAPEAEPKSIVVLASGDPLFFGIGSLLATALGKDNVKIYPNISSVAAAFAAIRESWQNAGVISLHGRKPGQDFWDTLTRRDKIAVLTDPTHNPAWLAEMLIQSGRTGFKICVLEQLGAASEKVNWYTLPEAAKKNFMDPNIVILKRIATDSSTGGLTDYPPLYPGMPESCFEHQRGLITKSEIRAVTLSKLRLTASDHVFWDLGAGSGSVSIEAARFIRNGQLIALEQHTDRIEQIKQNRKRFGITNLKILQATLPKGLDDLPRPDRVFIGGGGRNLETIIRTAADRLKPEGIMVINTVLLQNIDTALKTLKSEGLETEVVQIQISRSQAMPFSERLEAQNPVWIISGIKTE